MLINVHVVPRSKRNLLQWQQGILKAHLTAPPVDGAANEALLKLLAKSLSLPKQAITLVRGATSRQKVIEINGLTLQEIQQKLGYSE